MSFDMFLKMQPIEGDSLNRYYEDQIEVLDYSIEFDRPVYDISTGGRESGSPTFGVLHIGKWIDKASPKLFIALAKGTRFKAANLVLTRVDEGGPRPFHELRLKDVAVTSVEQQAASGDDRGSEQIKLTYSKFLMVHTPYDEEGQPEAEIKEGWDLREGKAIT